MNLFEQVLQFLCLSSSLNLVQRPNVVVNVLCVLGDAHVVQSLQTLLLAHSLQRIRQCDQVLEGSSKVPLRLLVLTPEAL